jgi:sugar lactone lactonase YvrE
MFAPLRAIPRFAAVAARLDSNGVARGSSEVFRDLKDAALLAEDLAWDASGKRFFVSSIHRRKIVSVDAGGSVKDFAGVSEPDFWGAFALRLDPGRHLLWATTAAIRTIENYDSADSGRAAVLAFDTRTGQRVRRADLPRDGRPHVLGDMTVGPDGVVYVTDSVGGGVYRLRAGAATLDTLLAPGTFTSPQTPVLAPGNRRLLIPDYPRGIAALEIGTGRVTWLPKPRTLASGGIDGLYAAKGGLIAVQNGTSPRRVLWLDTDAKLTRITGWRVLEQASGRLGEPSHAVLDGDVLYFLGDTGWDRVGQDEVLRATADSSAPVILRLALPKIRAQR